MAKASYWGEGGGVFFSGGSCFEERGREGCVRRGLVGGGLSLARVWMGVDG